MSTATTTREIRLPALSATMQEATLLAWKVAVGDEVRDGQPIAEVSTDKVDMDLEAPFAGIVSRLAVSPGDVVSLGAVMAVLETAEDDLLGGLDLAPSTGPTEAPPAPTPAPVTTAAPGRIIPASPPARKMARENGIDLRDVTPTGARGQVTPTDVKRHAESLATRAPAPAAPAAALAAAPSSAAATVPAVDDAKRLAVRRATVEVMGRSSAIPQFTLYRTLRLDRAASRRGGVSWTTILVRALAQALRAHPELNARWDETSTTTVPFGGVAVGLAVDRPGVGLVVATVADPDVGDPETTDQAVRLLADRAKTGKLRPEDMAQASITLSNLGGLGVDRFNALLFPPQAAILSAGSIKMRPVATGDGALKAELTCEVGLTIDHRVADGADGARFLDTFAGIAESGG